MKKLLIASLLLVGIFAVTLGAANNAEAACNATGKIAYMYMTTTVGYVYLQVPHTTYTTGGYYWRVSDNEIADILSDAANSGKSIRVYGNATSCSGTTWRWGGTAVRVNIYPSY